MRAEAERGAVGARRPLALAVAATVAIASVAGCGPLQRMSRPDGDGGWSADERRAEVDQIGRSAGVAVDGVRAAGATGGVSAATSGTALGAEHAPAAGTDAADSDTGREPARAATDAAELPMRRSDEPAGVRRGGDRSPDRIDLPTALAMADRGNRRIRAAERQLDATGERVRDVRGRLLPATSASARYTWYTDAQTTKVDLPPGLLPPGTTPVVTVRDAENGVVNSTVAIPIDLTGELWHTLAAAQAGYRGERARVWAVTLEQQLRVVQAYFDLLEALRLREVAEDTLAVYRRQ